MLETPEEEIDARIRAFAATLPRADGRGARRRKQESDARRLLLGAGGRAAWIPHLPVSANLSSIPRRASSSAPSVHRSRSFPYPSPPSPTHPSAGSPTGTALLRRQAHPQIEEPFPGGEPAGRRHHAELVVDHEGRGGGLAAVEVVEGEALGDVADPLEPALGAGAEVAPEVEAHGVAVEAVVVEIRGGGPAAGEVGAVSRVVEKTLSAGA